MTMRPSIIRPGDGRAFLTAGRVLVESGVGDFSVFEQTLPVTPTGVPLHLHRSFDEAFYVLEGVLEVDVGDLADRCGAGTLVFVPRGVAHRFANPGPAPVRMLVLGSSLVQALVEEVAPLVNQQPPDVAAIVAAFARYDSALVQPAG